MYFLFHYIYSLVEEVLKSVTQVKGAGWSVEIYIPITKSTAIKIYFKVKMSKKTPKWLFLRIK